MVTCLGRKDIQIRSNRVETLNVDWTGDVAQDEVTDSLSDIGFLPVFVRQVGKNAAEITSAQIAR